MHYAIRLLDLAEFNAVLAHMEAIRAGRASPDELWSRCHARFSEGTLRQFHDKFPSAFDYLFSKSAALVRNRGVGWETELFGWAVAALAMPLYQRSYSLGTRESPNVVFLGDYDAGLLRELLAGDAIDALDARLKASPFRLPEGPMILMSNRDTGDLQHEINGLIASRLTSNDLRRSVADKLTGLLTTVAGTDRQFALAFCEVAN